MENLNETFITKDVGEASSLISMKAILRDIQWKDGVGYFIFQDSKFCSQLSQQYYFGTLLINARTLTENLKMLKRKLYNSNREAPRFNR